MFEKMNQMFGGLSEDAALVQKSCEQMIESLTQCDQIVQFCKVLGNFVLANVAQIFGYFENLS